MRSGKDGEYYYVTIESDEELEKLKELTDKDRRPLFSIEVTGDIRIVYSFEPKNCTVFIWRIGRYKKAYRF